MVRNDLLTSIWSGDVCVRTGADRSPLAILLDGILTVPTVSLVVSCGIDRPTAFADSVELLPGLQLGDVLAEELGFDIPINCVILLEPEAATKADAFSATDLGRDLGRVLTSVASGSLKQHGQQFPAMFDERPEAMVAARAAVQSVNP